MLNPLSILLVTILSSTMAMAVLGSLWRAAIPLMARADGALYAAKESGRNRVMAAA